MATVSRRRTTRVTNKRYEALKESKCKYCKNAKFDATWGEYKCLVHEIYLYNYNKIYECDECDPIVNGKQ